MSAVESWFVIASILDNNNETTKTNDGYAIE